MSYTHIKPAQQVELAVLLRAGLKQSEIALILGKDPSSVSREIKRNRADDNKYKARIAKRKTKARRLSANRRFRKITGNKKLRRYIIRKLRKYWSPEQIAGKLKKKYGKTIVSHETIYRFIYKYRDDLKEILRCRKGKYKKRYGTGNRIKKRKEAEESKKKRIDTRSEMIESRERLGDFEGDTIVGLNRKDRILTYVDRRSGYLIARIIHDVTAEKVKKHTSDSFRSLSADKRFSITYDNGSEFSAYELIERETGMEVYFAYPYHSWERGTNENTNGLLRQFYPKKSSFAGVTQEKLDKIVHLINNRPRKRLGYLTPYEVFVKNCTLELN